MHAPDGFLNAATAVGTGALSAGTVAAALRQSREELGDKQVPLAGLTAAFVFAAQMFNFPVAAGTTGHLLGGALAAILLGPWVGSIVVTVVVVVQALAFADGGLTALGYNVLNMALVTAFGGWAVFRLARRLLPATPAGVTLASGVAAGASVVLSAAAFSLEWLFGATVPVPFTTVFGAMVGVHLLIGIGEGVISGMAIGAVLATRPDLVHGARDLRSARGDRRRRVRWPVFVAGAVTVALLFTVAASRFGSSDPDGLQSVANRTGIAEAGQGHALGSSLFADYATRGIEDEGLGLALAGTSGALLTLLVGSGVLLAARDRRRDRREEQRMTTDLPGR